MIPRAGDDSQTAWRMRRRSGRVRGRCRGGRRGDDEVAAVLAKLVKLDTNDELTAGQRRFFYATNVDYTFCADDGRPLFSVEFDGIGGGYSSSGKYRQARATADPHRQLKMDFKLRVSNQVAYPLVVVSFDELQAQCAHDCRGT